MDKTSDFNLGVDGEGRALPYSSEQVREIVADTLARGKLILVIGEVDDRIAMNVFGPPSRDTLSKLEQVCHAYRNMLRGY